MDRLGVILRAALALGEHYAEAVLTPCVTLLGHFAVPAAGQREILRYAVTVRIHIAEFGLRFCVSLLGAQTASPCRLGEFQLSQVCFVGWPNDRPTADHTCTENGSGNLPKQLHRITLLGVSANSTPRAEDIL
jgi:hypothetical protein